MVESQFLLDTDVFFDRTLYKDSWFTSICWKWCWSHVKKNEESWDDVFLLICKFGWCHHWHVWVLVSDPAFPIAGWFPASPDHLRYWWNTIVDPKMWLMDEILLSDGQTFGMLLYQFDFYYINFRDLYSSQMGCRPWDIYYIKCFSVSFINSMSLGAMRQSRCSSPIDPFCRHVEPITAWGAVRYKTFTEHLGSNTWHISS